MRLLQTATLVGATVSTGLMAGLFAGFAYSVMPGLRRASDLTAIEAMQNINKAIVNPVFMLPFMGSIPLLALAAVLAWRGHGRAALPWIIAAVVLYLIAFGITSGIHVPLNDRLAQAGHPQHLDHAATVRERFENTWIAWNVVRAVVHTAAFACLVWALVVYRAHRQHEVRSAGSAVEPRNQAAPSAVPVPPSAQYAQFLHS